MPAAAVPTMTVEQLQERMAVAGRPVLLDVREPEEWAICRLPGAQHIPMSEIEGRLGELDPSREIVVYCHHGMRSRKVAELLMQQGFVRVASLAGGIDAWSDRIDPAMPRY